MSELAKLEEYLGKPSPATKRNFSEATKKSYLSNYKKLTALLDKEIHNTSQKRILEVIEDENQSIATQNALINIALIVRSIYDLNVSELTKKREANKKPLAVHTKEVNKKLDLPSYQDLLDYLESLFYDDDCTGFIINYLLIYYGARNADVNFTITKLKRDTKASDDKNYMWLSATNKKALWVRKVYKTAGTYGTKNITITDKRFLAALKKCKDKTLLPNENNLGLYVKKLTLNEIGEGNYFKILIDHFKGNLKKLKELSESRGTSVDTIINNYDIDKKN